MQLDAEIKSVHPGRTFAIAHGASDSFEHVILSVEAEGFTGRGESAPAHYYGQTAYSDLAALKEARIDDPWDVEAVLRENSSLPASALCALDCALHDLAARRLGVPLYRFLGLSRPEPVTAYTLAIADTQTNVGEAEGLSYPILKIKVGGTGDLETVRAVSEVSGAELWVDANGAFSPEEAVEVAGELKGLGVSMLEQPVPAQAGPEALKAITEAAAPVPVIADESAHTAADVLDLDGCVSGVNVKLAKSGGIRGAMEMIQSARSRGMAVMLGSMVETSLGVSPAAHLAGLADFVDLDGPLLLADDPFTGLDFDGARILLSDRPGTGIEPA